MYKKAREDVRVPTEGKMAQPLEREQWYTGVERLLFCLGFTTM